jgi:uncharacterized protein
MIHPIIAHVEIPVAHLNKASEFYNALFGWEFKPFGNGYSLFNPHKGITAGLRESKNISKGETTIFHIHVDDIDSILQKVEKLGGKKVREKTIIPVMGWYALIGDPDGNTIGLFQSH